MRKQSPPKSGAAKILGAIGYCLFLLIVLVAGTAAGWISQSTGLVGLTRHIFDPKDPQHTFRSNTLTLLVLGCDEDIADFTGKILKKQARSDMMLIAKLDFDHNMVTGVSIPRDTRCRMPGYHVNKINAYHEIAPKGQEAALTQKAVEYLLPGVHIDRVVTLDFDEFQAVVNMVGGVPINVEKPLNYDDNAGHLHIHLKKGPQVVNGYDAMAFVRFRHGDDDFARQARQKKFLLAFKQRAMQNWEKVPELVDQGEKVLGDALNQDEIASLALFARKLPPQNIQWGQIPVKDIPGSYDFALDKAKINDVLAEYKLIEPQSRGVSPVGGPK